jgi:bromodomain-containing factor 1
MGKSRPCACACDVGDSSADLTCFRNTNHYDALFDDEPPTTNGIHLDESATSNHNLLHPEPVASKAAIAGDPSIAPIIGASGGIDSAAAFLPSENGDSLPDSTNASADSSIPHAVEQPESNLRAEPPAQYQVPVETDAMDIGIAEIPPVEVPTTGPAAEELQVTSGAQSPVDKPMTTDSPIVDTVTPKLDLAEDKMDTTGEIHAVPLKEIEDKHETSVAVDEPIPTIETAPEPEVPSVEPLSIDTAQTGQVRPREDDDDEFAPAAKRARTATGEEGLPTPAAEAKVLATATTPAEPGGPASANSSTASAKTAAQLDSNKMTTVQHKFLLSNLRKAKKVKSAEWFLKPVDPVALNIPTYPTIITQPMDLGTLEQKLKDDVYATANDFMADFELIVSNSITFNGPTHPVSYAAMNFKAYFVKIMNGIPKGPAAAAPTTITSQPKKPVAAPKAHRSDRDRKAIAKSPVDKPAGFLNEHGMPIIRRDSSAQNDRPKREIHPPKRDLPAAGPRPKKKKHQLELKFCQHVMNELFKKKYQTFAYPFMVPVDPVALNIPNYHKIIKKPMDFGTIQANLNASQYGSAKDFYNDANLVFQNCFKFNPNTDEVHKMGKMLEGIFNQTWAIKEQWLLENAPASEPQTEDDEDDEEEEEEIEDPSDAVRRMQEIQQQIAALSAEALKLTAVPKRASPKAAAPKRSKTSKPKRASVTGLPVVPKSSSKIKTVKKPHKKLTLDQKREVSEGIAALDEAQMRKAVQIIRNGVPSLRVSN